MMSRIRGLRWPTSGRSLRGFARLWPFLAGGLALEAFAIEAFPEHWRKVLALFLVAIGMLISAGAAVRWVSIESSMRNGKPLPLPAIVPLLGLGGAATASVVIILIALN